MLNTVATCPIASEQLNEASLNVHPLPRFVRNNCIHTTEGKNSYQVVEVGLSNSSTSPKDIERWNSKHWPRKSLLRVRVRV